MKNEILANINFHKNCYFDIKNKLKIICIERKMIKDSLTEFFNIYDKLENKNELCSVRNYLLKTWFSFKQIFFSTEQELKSEKMKIREFNKILNGY